MGGLPAHEVNVTYAEWTYAWDPVGAEPKAVSPKRPISFCRATWEAAVQVHKATPATPACDPAQAGSSLSGRRITAIHPRKQSAQGFEQESRSNKTSWMDAALRG